MWSILFGAKHNVEDESWCMALSDFLFCKGVFFPFSIDWLMCAQGGSVS